MKILSIANHKGGTAKTTTARALGDYMAMSGYKTLLIDLDPQESLTLSCGFYQELNPSLVNVLGGAQAGDMHIAQITRRVRENLDLAPGSKALAAVELAIAPRLGREFILNKALRGLPYDLCIIDTPPSVSLLMINGLVASSGVIIPAQPTPADLSGVRLFLETLETIRAGLGKSIEVLGILPTFYDNRLNTHRAGIEAMLAAGWAVLPVAIGRSIRVAEAAANGESILTYEPGNPQAGNYKQLGELIEKWLKK